MKRLLRSVFERPKWKLYKKIIQAFQENGYIITSVKDYSKLRENTEKIVIFRHDVDNDPHAALIMARIEKDLNVSSTYYFRWKTANPMIVREIAKHFEVGLHYESLAQVLASQEQIQQVNEETIIKARTLLEHEVEAFQVLFGTIYSIASHGHRINSQTKTTNLQIVTQEFREKYQLLEAYDLQEENMVKISDGDYTRKFWKYDVSPFQAIKDQEKRIYFLTHPCHWNRNFYKRLVTRFYHKSYGVWV